jgi:hypothetical protein
MSAAWQRWHDDFRLFVGVEIFVTPKAGLVRGQPAAETIPGFGIAPYSNSSDKLYRRQPLPINKYQRSNQWVCQNNGKQTNQNGLNGWLKSVRRIQNTANHRASENNPIVQNIPVKKVYPMSLWPRAIRHALRNDIAFIGFHVLPNKLAIVFG